MQTWSEERLERTRQDTIILTLSLVITVLLVIIYSAFFGPFYSKPNNEEFFDPTSNDCKPHER